MQTAIIGCGEQGKLQAAAVEQVEYTSLKLVMDVDESKARRMGTQFEVPWTTDYDAVLADSDVDLVFLITPHFLHAEQAIRAATAKKHIIVEKPLATKVSDAENIVRVAQDNGVQLSVWFGFRYLPHVVKARKLVDNGMLGSIFGAQLLFQTNKPSAYYQSGYSGQGTDWRGRWDTSGGGVLIMNAIHYLDWLLYLVESDVAAVSAHYDTLNSNAEVEDAIGLWLSFRNGAIATVNVSSSARGVGDNLKDLRIWGSDGHLILAPPYQYYSSRRVDGNKPERWHLLEPLSGLRSPHVEYLDDFARSVLNGISPNVTPEEALHLQAVIEAAYESSRRKVPIKIAEVEKTVNEHK